MGNAFFSQGFTENLRRLNGNGTHQNRLSLCIGFNDRIHNRIDLFCFCLVNQIFVVNTPHRFIGRNLDNVHAVNITEFLFLSQGCTCHTGFLFVFIKEVLESNGGKGLAFPFDLHPFFCLDGLMKAVGVTSSRHNTACKFINDEHLIVFNHIIMVSVHQVMGTQRQNDVVLDFQMFGICQVVNMKEAFNLFHTIFGQGNVLFFFIDNVIPGFDDFFTHNGSHLRHLTAGFSPFQLTRQNIAGTIQFGRFAALTGNNQRCSGLVDQYGVNLINDGVVKTSLNQFFFINNHVISQIIKSQFVIGCIRNITIIGRFTFFRGHTV